MTPTPLFGASESSTTCRKLNTGGVRRPPKNYKFLLFAREQCGNAVGIAILGPQKQFLGPREQMHGRKSGLELI